MLVPPPETVEVPVDLTPLDAALQALPNASAVFLLWPRVGEPYLVRTGLLRRRLLRLLRPASGDSRILNLRAIASRIEYWLTGSRLESSLVSYELARRHFPSSYRKLLKLRLPAYVKLILTDPFPRTQITSRVSGSRDVYFGPFGSRAAAEEFDRQSLDLFQLRRCVETLAPHPGHPGCIYGEMNMCLRPCQQAVSPSEYHSEAVRISEFLSTGGASMLETISAARDRLSEEMNFEEAARQHKRYEKVEQVLALRDDLARRVDRTYGIAVTRSPQPDAVKLWFLWEGIWQTGHDLALNPPVTGEMIPLDQRLRELVAAVRPAQEITLRREEHLALLARWYYSTWRDGEWIAFEDPARIPYRKLVRSISRLGIDRSTSIPTSGFGKTIT